MILTGQSVRRAVVSVADQADGEGLCADQNNPSRVASHGATNRAERSAAPRSWIPIEIDDEGRMVRHPAGRGYA